MSEFLDEVLAAPEAPRRPPRRAGEGLSGSSKRFATLLTLMIGLTAVPTFIMVRVGVAELRSSAAAPVRPILLEVPEKPAPPNKQQQPQRQPPVIEPQQSWSLPVIPPEPVAPQREPILERKAVVDTSPRPVAKKRRAAKQSAAVPAPVEPSNLDTRPEPVRKPWKHTHHVERPRVEQPEKPDVAITHAARPGPYRDRTDRPRS